jgi:tetratricopeptide (TPR) repeat protein
MSVGGGRAQRRRLGAVILTCLAAIACLVPAALLGAPWWLFAGIAAVAFAAGMRGARQLLQTRLIPGRLSRPISDRLGSGDYLVPVELPVPPTPFVGREAEIRRMQAFLESSQAPGPRVIVISGSAGIGKTALAMRFAYLVADRFPDGQLLADLTSAADYQFGISSVLASFIEALQPEEGVVPADDKEQQSRYVELTRGRKLLIVVEDAHDEGELRKLLPADHSSVIIVTSRAPILLVADQLGVPLEPLDGDASLSLLTAMLGEPRVSKDVSAAMRIVENSAGYPLALRLAGASLANREHWGLSRAVLRMTQEEQRDRTGDSSAFDGLLDVTYAMLTLDERCALRMLGLLEEPLFEPWMLAALVGVDVPSAMRLTESLLREGLVQRVSQDSDEALRFRVHEHVLAYARTRLRAETSVIDRSLSLERLAEARRRRHERVPSQRLRKKVFGWQDQGRLVLALNAARDTLALAQTKGDKAAEGLALSALAELYLELGDIDDARALATAALDAPGVASRPRALRCLGKVRRKLHQAGEAETILVEARDLARKLGDPSEEIRVLRELAEAQSLDLAPGVGLDTAADAIRLCRQRADGGKRHMAGVLWAKGGVLLHAADVGAAIVTLAEAEEFSVREDQTLWAAWIRQRRSCAALLSKDFQEAARLATDSMGMFRDMRHRYGVGHCRLLLGRIYRDEGDLDDAGRLLEEALETFQNCGDPWIEAVTLHTLALNMLDQGHTSEGIGLLENAYKMFGRVGDQENRRQLRKELDSSAFRWRRFVRLGEKLNDAVNPGSSGN